MKLSESQINKFIKLYKEKYGVILEYQDALKEATQFIKMIQVVESHVD